MLTGRRLLLGLLNVVSAHRGAQALQTVQD